MHDHDHDHGIRALAARIRAAHDHEATKLEEQRRRSAELDAERPAHRALLSRLRSGLDCRPLGRSHGCACEDATPARL